MIIKKLRINNNFSQNELADKIGKDQSTIQRWETKDNEISLSSESISELGEILHCHENQLWGELPDQFHKTAKTIKNSEQLYNIIRENEPGATPIRGFSFTLLFALLSFTLLCITLLCFSFTLLFNSSTPTPSKIGE